MPSGFRIGPRPSTGPEENAPNITPTKIGQVENAQPKHHWREVNDSFAYILSHAGGPEMGFKIIDFSKFDPEGPEVSEIWEAPRFDVPTLGLRDSTAGEIVLAARPFLGGRSTINRVFFNRAMQAEGVEAEELWRYCLQTGDLMAHYGLGYTLYDLGRYQEAYRHLRAYTELVPADGWAWCWLGKACEAMGELEEARSTYEKAIELDGGETDAPELLVNLLDRSFRRESAGSEVPVSGRPRGEPTIRFVGEGPELREGVEIVLQDGVRRRDLVFFEEREDGQVAIRQAGPDDEGTVYYVHPESTQEELTFVRTNPRHLAAQREDSDVLGQLWKETFTNVGFFYRDADLADEVLEKYQQGMIIQERAYVDCSYLDGGLAARHRYLIITGKARDLHALVGMDRKYGPAIIQRNCFFKVLDVYWLRGHAQITLLHIPEELIGHLQTQELNEMEKKMVEAARTNFEENLARPAVPALTEAKWLERVAFPLGTSEEGDLFYGRSLEGPN
jgi:tetratricopeptide (TPR) repeat protein